MRFGQHASPDVFHFLPSNLPGSLYQREEARKVTKRGPNVADKTQKGILKQAVQFAPPGLLQDSNIFPLSQEVIQAFLQLTERSRPTVISSGLFDVVVDDQYQYSLIDTRDGTVLFSADVAAAFEYIKKFVPQALFNFARVAREFGVGDPETGQVYEVLLKHRKQRSASKGLDTLSKIDELAAIDQDHVVFKFPVEHFKICDKVLHIGAGTNVGGSQFVLWDNYDRVKCIDPRLTPDRHNESALFDARKVEPGWDIVSDVANGDEYGLTLFHQNKLLDELWDLRHGRMIMVKLGVSEDVRKDIRGIFARKPRPHNLEVIVVLAEYGEPLYELFERLKVDIISANRKRTQRFYAQRFGKEVKPTYGDPWDIQSLFEIEKYMPPLAARNCPKIRRRSRNKALLLNSGDGTWTERHEKLRMLERDHTLKGAGLPLPNTFHIGSGPISAYDPGFVDPRLSMESVICTAKRRGLTVTFENRFWRVC